MPEQTKGIFAMVSACLIWGLAALYYKHISHVPPLEVLSHRTIWSLVFLFGLLSYTGRLNEIGAMLFDIRSLIIVFVAALLISLNWFTYIVAIQIGRVLESSLGYYIFPLVAVLLGYMFLGERLTRVQLLAVGLAALAVVILTIGLGVAPWISLTLAISFGFYGLSKKSLKAGPVVSVMGEVIVLTPIALIWLWGVHQLGWAGFDGKQGGYFGNGWNTGLVNVGRPDNSCPTGVDVLCDETPDSGQCWSCAIPKPNDAIRSWGADLYGTRYEVAFYSVWVDLAGVGALFL